MNSARACSLMVLSLLSACSGSRATPVAAPVTVSAADAATATDAVVAVADVAPPTDPRREALTAAWMSTHPEGGETFSILAGPTDYHDAATPGARVAAVIKRGSSAILVVTPVPFDAEKVATLTLPNDVSDAGEVVGMTVRDVNGDHRDDVAVFQLHDRTLEGYVPLGEFMSLVTYMPEPYPQLASLERIRMQLLGTGNDAEFATALQTLNTYEPPAQGMSPMRFISRLRYATPAQFRAAVAPGGLRLCTDYPDRTGNRHKRCRTVLVSQMTDAMITGVIRNSLGEFTEVITDDLNGLQGGSCQPQGREIHCGASVGGPSGDSWSLIGEGASMRLIELAPWAESS